MNLELATKIGGRSNPSPLTPLGERQSRALGRHMRRLATAAGTAPPFFASTAVRAYETARLMLEEMGHDDPAAHLTTSERLLELDMGDWEGCSRSECYCPENLAIIEANTQTFAPPGGESQLQVEQRMVAFIEEVVKPAAAKAREQGLPAVVVGHGLAFKTLLRHVLDSDPRMSRKIVLHNTAVTELGWVESEKGDGGAGLPGGGGTGGLQAGWHVLRVNDTSHLFTDGQI
jgi:probable phosphoglycerate mutase